jgi:alpha-1,2-mannosyltransferase
MIAEVFSAGRQRLLVLLERNTLPLKEKPVKSWLTGHARAVFRVGLAAAVLMEVLWPSGGQIDMRVYQAGADALLHGRPLYSHGVLGTMDFTYPPFAAIFFVPLAALWLPILHVVWALGNLTLLLLIVRRFQERLGLAPELTLAFVGIALWLEPVRTSLVLGQINVILLGLVVFDLCRKRPSMWAGVGVGLAAGLKLTPLIFVVYLLFARRWREAGVALATFAATVLMGLLFVPEAGLYWFGGTFGDSSRIGPLLSWSDQSIHGMIARLVGQRGSTIPWVLVGGAVALAGTAIAGMVDRRGDRVLALGLSGMTAAAVSPFSWEHHWVWFLPVIMAVAARGWAWYLPFLACVAVPTDLPPVDFRHGMPTGVISIDFEGPVAFLIRNSYVITTIALLVFVAVQARRRPLTPSPPRRSRSLPVSRCAA